VIWLAACGAIAVIDGPSSRPRGSAVTSAAAHPSAKIRNASRAHGRLARSRQIRRLHAFHSVT
jgi:hypothetical protein